MLVAAFSVALVIGKVLGPLSLREARARGARIEGCGALRADLLLRQHLPVHDLAAPDRAFRSRSSLLLHAFGVVLKQILLNLLIMSACFGAAVAALHIELPVALDRTITFLNAAALFVLGVTVALRAFDRVPWEVRCPA